jgi:hypothetical protein
MPKTELVNLIKDARLRKLTDKDTFQSLRQGGWHDSDIKEALTYVDLNDQNNVSNLSVRARQPIIILNTQRGRWINLVAIVLGYTWTVSGFNKFINSDFTYGFADYLKLQLMNSSVPEFYKSLLSNLMIPNAHFFAYMVEFSELTIGVLFLGLGIYSLSVHSRWIHTILFFVYLASFVMILNIIISSGIPFPWFNSENVYASGVSVEYFILFLSILAPIAHYSEAGQD